MTQRMNLDEAFDRFDDADDFFMCLAGRFTIEMRDDTVTLGPGDVYTVPRAWSTSRAPSPTLGT